MQAVRQWPLRVKAGALLTVLSFVFLASVSGIIGNRADALVVWALPVLFRQFTLPVWGLLLMALMGGCLATGIVLFLHRNQVLSANYSRTPTEVNLGQLDSAASVSDPREQAQADLAELLQELAERKWQFLPRYLGRLQYILHRLGRDEDAAWCQAELDGYTPENTPPYRYADVTIIRRWIGSGGKGGTVYLTASGTKPEERTESMPFYDPVSDLLRMTTNKTTRASKEEIPWREDVVTIPKAVRGVVERILSECYSRARAARSDDTA
jgi:hypothetical protein